VGTQARSYNEAVPRQLPDRPSAEAAELSTLQAELDALRNGAVDRWLDRTAEEGRRLQEFESSLSWRVTRPLRVARRGMAAVRTMGPVAVIRIVAERARAGRG
jgi:hypothetical protein